MTDIEMIQKALDDRRQGDYINIDGSHNQILNVNIFDKKSYDEFYNSNDWVRGGNMVDPVRVRNYNIVVSYYGLVNSGAEYSFNVGKPNGDTQQLALDKFVIDWNDQHWNL